MKESQFQPTNAQAVGAFFEDCGGPFDLTPAHTITCYESQPTSGAEIAIMAFLKSEPWRFARKRLLHVGIGNGSFASEFMGNLTEYVGITISLPEIEIFEQKFVGAKNTKIILLNKYDSRMYLKLQGDFDLIIDTLLKSYACCEKHFREMMVFFTSKLKRGGTLITTQTGVLWGWKGNINRAYTPGAQLDPAIGEFRILGLDNLPSLCERLGLTMSAFDVPIQTAMDDRIIILTKN